MTGTNVTNCPCKYTKKQNLAASVTLIRRTRLVQCNLTSWPAWVPYIYRIFPVDYFDKLLLFRNVKGVASFDEHSRSIKAAPSRSAIYFMDGSQAEKYIPGNSRFPAADPESYQHDDSPDADHDPARGQLRPAEQQRRHVRIRMYRFCVRSTKLGNVPSTELPGQLIPITRLDSVILVKRSDQSRRPVSRLRLLPDRPMAINQSRAAFPFCRLPLLEEVSEFLLNM